MHEATEYIFNRYRYCSRPRYRPFGGDRLAQTDLIDLIDGRGAISQALLKNQKLGRAERRSWESGHPTLPLRCFYTCNLFRLKPKNSRELNRLKSQGVRT